MQHVNPMTQQFMASQKMGIGNFRETYAQPTTLIDRPDFVNRGNVIHNNMGPNLLSEHVMEYKIHIDSSDRNTDNFPSPFKMKVTFGLAKSYQEPLIAKKFKNIKYITLDSIILPRTVAIDTSKINDDPVILYPTDSTYPTTAPVVATGASGKSNVLTNHKFIVVRIEELCSDKNVGTSNLLDRDTFAFIPDTSLGLDSVLWKPMHNNRVIYRNAQLFNISSLTITILDENGNQIVLVDENGNKIIGTNMVDSDSDYIKYISDNISEESVAYTNTVTQVILNFTFGVIENELNTLTNY